MPENDVSECQNSLKSAPDSNSIEHRASYVPTKFNSNPIEHQVSYENESFQSSIAHKMSQKSPEITDRLLQLRDTRGIHKIGINTVSVRAELATENKDKLLSDKADLYPTENAVPIEIKANKARIDNRRDKCNKSDVVMTTGQISDGLNAERQVTKNLKLTCNAI